MFNPRLFTSSSKLDEFKKISSNSGIIETLTLARLTELALLCAGNYADNGCIVEVGDLLFNPRLILVHIKSESYPVKKERHKPFTVQFNNMASSLSGVVEWLKYNTFLETVKEPFLTHLVSLLEEIGCSDAYLVSVQKRLSKIVRLTGRLSAFRILEHMTIMDWISSFQENDRPHLEKLLCRFDKTVFNDLGGRIYSSY